ncbi:MAG: hypothetical protein WCJ19_05575 [bacterium]
MSNVENCGWTPEELDALERHALDGTVKPKPDPIFGRNNVDGGF